MKTATITAIGLLSAGATMLAVAQVPTPPPTPAQPVARRRGGGQEPQPPGPNGNSQYRLGPNSMPQEGVPREKSEGRSRCPAKSIPVRSIPTGCTCPHSTIPQFRLP